MEDLGDDIAASVLAQQEKLHDRQYTIRTENLQRAFAMANEANRRPRDVSAAPNYLRSELQGEKWERENANLIAAGFYLPADVSYKVSE